MNIEVKQLLDVDEKTLEKITDWMYRWWGYKDGYSLEEVWCYMQHSLLKDRMPQTYGLYLEDKIIGMYQFMYEDLSIRPDIYPWLANVYIDEKFRGKGYARVLLESVKLTASKLENVKELYLYTKHENFYEKFGWEFISEIDTYSKNPRFQRLYKFIIEK